jgi:hypothetical protein
MVPEPDAEPDPLPEPLPEPDTLPELGDRSLLELEEPVPDTLPEPDALPDPDTLPDVLPLLDLAFPPSPESDELDAEQPPMARTPTRSGTVVNKFFRVM